MREPAADSCPEAVLASRAESEGGREHSPGQNSESGGGGEPESGPEASAALAGIALGLNDMHVLAAAPTPAARTSSDWTTTHDHTAETPEVARTSVEPASSMPQSRPTPTPSDNPPDCSDP
eukprot:7982212-Alexandrium_andersonii.AAC.1